MEVQNKNLSLVVGVVKKTPDIAVALSFPFNGVSSCALRQLSCNCSSGEGLVQGSHEAALAFALFEAVRTKLCGSSLEVVKSRVSGVSCGADDAFTIRWNCQGTGSALRKSCGLALSCLAPQKLFSKYSENIKFLSGRGGNKDEFAHCVKKMVGSLANIQLVAVGKINTDQKKLKDILGVLSNKVASASADGNGKAPEVVTSESKRDFPIIKCSGVSAAALADYIRANAGGMGIEVGRGVVTVFNESWTTKQKTLSDQRRINDYIEKKYTRLGEEFPNTFAYFALTQGFASAQTVAGIIKSKPTPTKLAGMIKNCLA